VSVFVEDMSRNKCLFQVPVFNAYVLYPFVTCLLTLSLVLHILDFWFVIPCKMGGGNLQFGGARGPRLQSEMRMVKMRSGYVKYVSRYLEYSSEILIYPPTRMYGVTTRKTAV
jgi:hypothetical protein